MFNETDSEIISLLKKFNIYNEENAVEYLKTLNDSEKSRVLTSLRIQSNRSESGDIAS